MELPVQLEHRDGGLDLVLHHELPSELVHLPLAEVVGPVLHRARAKRPVALDGGIDALVVDDPVKLGRQEERFADTSVARLALDLQGRLVAAGRPASSSSFSRSSSAVATRTVDTHVSTLRAKIEVDPARPRHILTVRKVGYRLVP